MLERVIAMLLLVAACGEHNPTPEPDSPPPPQGLDTHGKPLYELDTSSAEKTAVLANAPAGASLIGRLASSDGRREIVLRTGGSDHRVTDADWNILATGTFDATGTALICWNVLTGPASSTGGMPHPSTGLEVRCRTWTDSPGPVLTASDVAQHEWLIDVTSASPGHFTLTTYRDATGWMFNAMAGDGYLRRDLAGGSFGPPSTQSRNMRHRPRPNVDASSQRSRASK